MPRKKLGPYELNDVLGRGGMGTVYRAVHSETGEVCAIKALTAAFSEDPHFRKRFESEIQALLKLDHPNIVRILSFGQDGGQLFFAMELVDGPSLFHRQRQGERFDWREVLGIATDVAAGLRHAHDRGIIHRDLKPGNLLQAPTGEIKITDFGIAKSFGVSQDTGTNVLGTMDFMSPEQAKGEPVTVRSDLYSLGTVLYSLLAGRPPFSGESVEESLRNLIRMPPPSVARVVPDVPVELDALIRKLMSKNPEQRIPTAQALLYRIDEIENKLRDEAEAKTTSRKRSGDTFDLVQPLPAAFDSATRSGTQKGGPIEDESSRRPTTVETDAPRGPVRPASESTDFFNTVDRAEPQRPEVEATDEGGAGREIWLLLAGLVGVLAVVVFGIVYAYRPPSADELYRQIEESWSTPEKVRTEIGLFLEHHPEDLRTPEVTYLKGIADALALYNRLQVRERMVGSRFTAIERQFLKCMAGLEDKPELTRNQLQAFVRVNEDVARLAPEDAACVRAADFLQQKIGEDERTRIAFHRDRIESRLNEAEGLPPESREDVYRSIIELYRNDEWASDLVERATRGLEEK